jgi:hypothetical protein
MGASGVGRRGRGAGAGAAVVTERLNHQCVPEKAGGGTAFPLSTMVLEPAFLLAVPQQAAGILDSAKSVSFSAALDPAARFR